MNSRELEPRLSFRHKFALWLEGQLDQAEQRNLYRQSMPTQTRREYLRTGLIIIGGISALPVSIFAIDYFGRSTLKAALDQARLPDRLPPTETPEPKEIVIGHQSWAHYENRVFFFNETPGLVLEVLRPALRDLIENDQLGMSVSKKYPIAYVYFPENASTNEAFKNYSHKVVSTAIREPYEYLDVVSVHMRETLAKISQISNPTERKLEIGKLLSLSLAANLRISFLQRNPKSLFTQELSPKERQLIENYPLLRVINLGPLLIQTQAQTGRETTQIDRLIYHLKEGDSEDWNDFIAVNQTPGLTINFDAVALKRFIIEYEIGNEHSETTIVVFAPLESSETAKLAEAQAVNNLIPNLKRKHQIQPRQTIIVMPMHGMIRGALIAGKESESVRNKLKIADASMNGWLLSRRRALLGIASPKPLMSPYPFTIADIDPNLLAQIQASLTPTKN